jgi:hypothetical protein
MTMVFAFLDQLVGQGARPSPGGFLFAHRLIDEGQLFLALADNTRGRIHRADQPVCPISSNFAPHAAPRCMRGFLHYAARTERHVPTHSQKEFVSRPDFKAG